MYGPGTETLVEDEDAQPLEEPLVARVVRPRFEVLERDALPSHAPPAFLAALLAAPQLARHCAVVGGLHAGKTSLVDVLLGETHTLRSVPRPDGAPARFTDTRVDEQARAVSLKAVPLSLVVPSSSGKHFLLNVVDAPGHTDFCDELAASLRLADGVLLVVDCAEGPGLGTERALAAACAEGLPVCLLLNKLDRLVVELKLPPQDAYHKLRAVLDELNGLLAAAAPGAPAFDPAAGNVAFASTRYGWSFTLDSFAATHVAVQLGDGGGGGPAAGLAPRLAPRLWGDWFYHPADRALRRVPPAGGGSRSFVSFVLEPLYKLHAACLGEPPEALAATLAHLGVALPRPTLTADPGPLLRAACGAFFGPSVGLVDMLLRGVPPAREAGAAKARRCYAGPQDGPAARAMATADAGAPLCAFVAKLVPSADGARFDALVRVMAGTLRVGDAVRVLGEGFSQQDEEDSGDATVTALWVLQARFRLPIAAAPAGAWVLVAGVDGPISKTATLVAPREEAPAVFAPLLFRTTACVKVAVEPLAPADLPKLVAGLRAVAKSYPAAVARVEARAGQEGRWAVVCSRLSALLRSPHSTPCRSPASTRCAARASCTWTA